MVLHAAEARSGFGAEGGKLGSSGARRVSFKSERNPPPGIRIRSSKPVGVPVKNDEGLRHRSVFSEVLLDDAKEIAPAI